MSVVWTLTIAVVAAVTTGWLQYVGMMKIEFDKLSRRREAVGVMLQAELIHFHYAMKLHSRSMSGYISRARLVGGTTEADYPKFGAGTKFPVFQSSITDIGLFSSDIAYQIAYCYFNAERFFENQQRFINDLPGLLNSNVLETRARDLSAVEMALMTQIERIIPMLAGQSRAIPFDPKSG